MPKWLFPAFIFTNLAVILYFWWQGSGALLGYDLDGVLLGVGRLAGLLLAFTVLLQFTMMGRSAWVERSFGLDKVARIHKTNGNIVFVFLVLHPLCIILSYAAATRQGFVRQLLSFLNIPDLFNAILAFCLFFLIIGLSIYFVRSRIKYEMWYWVHLLTYLAVALAWGHQLNLGEDFLAQPLFTKYWMALYLFVFGNVLIFRFLLPISRSLRHGFRVEKVVPEGPEATSVYISGKDLSSYPARPGQFFMLRFLAKGFWYESHPFSFSMLPNGKQLRVTIKSVGDFTAKIRQLKPGSPVFIDGPYGLFTRPVSHGQPALLIAGGIGITPIRSLVEEMAIAGQDVVLLYSNSTQKETVFLEELTQLAKKYRFPFHLILTKEKNFSGEAGRIDAEKIQRLVPDFAQRHVYLCGPVPMMESVKSILLQLGVPKEQIHYERFAL